MICVFDCETVPCAESLKNAFDYSGDEREISLLAQKEQFERTGSEFLPICFHKVVTISVVLADDYGKFIRVNTMEADGEKDIIAKFLNFIDKYNPRLVSFNGRGFDMPLLMLRAMRYNLNAHAYFDTDNKALGKDKWVNYRSRYQGEKFHFDLLDQISEFKSVSGLSLDKICASLGLPGKYDTDGSQVLELFYAQKQEKIDEYCESDVLNTYMLFLKYEILRGNLTLEDYATNLKEMKNYILENRQNYSYTPIFAECVDVQLKRIKDEIS